MKRQKLRRQKDRCCSGWGRKWQEMVFQYNRNHAKILWSGTIHTSERKILFGALPGCCWSIDSCLTDPWLVRFCFVSLISQWHSFQLRISLKLGKHNQCFQWSSVWEFTSLPKKPTLFMQLHALPHVLLIAAVPYCSSWWLMMECRTLANIILCRLWSYIIILSCESCSCKGSIICIYGLVQRSDVRLIGRLIRKGLI